MKRFFVLVLAVLGLLAIGQNDSKAQGFSITFGGGPAYYGPYYSGGYYYPGYYYYNRPYYYRPYYYRGYNNYYHRHPPVASLARSRLITHSNDDGAVRWSRLNEVPAEVPTARKGGAWTTRPFTAGSTGIGDPANKSETPLAYWSLEETAILAP